MINFKLFLSTTLIFTLSFFGIKIYRNFNHSRDLKQHKKIESRETAKVLNECFDFKNKSKRSIKESIELIEFCLIEYGSNK